jgi:hypothetical protein
MPEQIPPSTARRGLAHLTSIRRALATADRVPDACDAHTDTGRSWACPDCTALAASRGRVLAAGLGTDRSANARVVEIERARPRVPQRVVDAARSPYAD